MSVLLLAVSMLAVANPARVRSAVPAVDTVPVAAWGAAISWVALLPLVAVGQALLAPVDVASSTVRMGVALVLVLQGGLALVSGPPKPEPSLPGRRAALVPVAFPVTLTPGLGLLAIAAAEDHTAPLAWAFALVALVSIPLVAAACPILSAVRSRVLAGLGRATGAVLVLCGAAVMVNGLFDL